MRYATKVKIIATSFYISRIACQATLLYNILSKCKWRIFQNDQLSEG